MRVCIEPGLRSLIIFAIVGAEAAVLATAATTVAAAAAAVATPAATVAVEPRCTMETFLLDSRAIGRRFFTSFGSKPLRDQ